MELTTRTLPARKHIALVAHDHCKQMLMSWVERHQPLLEQHVLYATGTTGNLISRATGMNVNAMLSGCVFRSIRSRIGIEVRSAIRIHSINRELNFFYRFLT
ncbi:TPA: hypothetical protein ACWR4F_002967, partial [Escherichia coli]